jgi:hypothetical protein
MAVVPWTPFVLLGTSNGHLHAAQQCDASSAQPHLTTPAVFYYPSKWTWRWWKGPCLQTHIPR